MRIISTIFATAALTAATVASADETASVDDVATSAAMCMLSASTEAADRSRFESDAWTHTDNGFEHVSAPISIEFPSDSDGVSRICVVRATLSEKGDQKKLTKQLNSMLNTKPMKQSDSEIWMVSTATGTRGIQFFHDKSSDKPQVRLIGAAF